MANENSIQALREERKLTIEQLAERVGLSVSYVSRLEKGVRNLAVKHIDLFAAAFNVPRERLLSTVRPQEVSVVGVIGAGGKIDTSSAQISDSEPLYKVSAPIDVPDGALAFQVVGDSMWPKYDDGDVVICSMFSDYPDGVLGFPAAVETEDHSRYLKRVLIGSQPGLYHLESYNAPLMPDVHVVSFSSVICTIAASQVSKITDKVRRDAMRQITTNKPARA